MIKQESLAYPLKFLDQFASRLRNEGFTETTLNLHVFLNEKC